jgi:hypothetical protein
MRRIIALSLLMLFSMESTGCYAWHQDTRPVPTLQSAKSTDDYRITLTTGRVVELTSLHVQHDSLLGAAVEYGMAPTGFPVTQVTRVARRSLNAGATGVTVGAVALLGLVVAWVIASSSCSPHCYEY